MQINMISPPAVFLQQADYYKKRGDLEVL